jgi:hypothetical protein
MLSLVRVLNTPTMEDAEELLKLCGQLEQFGLPRAIVDFDKNRFVAWNKSFMEQSGYSNSEMRQISPKHVVLQGASNFPLARDKEELGAEFSAGAVRTATEARVVPAYVAKSNRNLGYVMLQPVELATGPDAEMGEVVGQEKERIRIMKAFHDEVSSPMLGAIFAIAKAKNELESNDSAEPRDLEEVSSLLSNALEKMGEVLEGPKVEPAAGSPDSLAKD